MGKQVEEKQGDAKQGDAKQADAKEAAAKQLALQQAMKSGNGMPAIVAKGSTDEEVMSKLGPLIAMLQKGGGSFQESFDKGYKFGRALVEGKPPYHAEKPP